MEILGIPAGELASLTGNVIVGGYLGWKGYKERRARKRGVLANPQRCIDHEVKLARIDERLGHVEEDIHDIKQRIG